MVLLELLRRIPAAAPVLPPKLTLHLDAAHFMAIEIALLRVSTLEKISLALRRCNFPEVQDDIGTLFFLWRVLALQRDCNPLQLSFAEVQAKLL